MNDIGRKKSTFSVIRNSWQTRLASLHNVTGWAMYGVVAVSKCYLSVFCYALLYANYSGVQFIVRITLILLSV